jgi:hypothetical protein
VSPAMLLRFFCIAILFTSMVTAANGPWDKPPEQWTQADVFRIVRDSPWSPVKFAIESEYKQRYSDPQSGVATDSPSHVQGAVVRGITVSRAHPLPAVTVLWWSSRIIRLAQSKLLELRSGAAAKERIDAGEASDYILAVEGDEPLRILREAREDLHDTVFLELENGGTLDFTAVKFVDDTDAETLRTEFHFARLLNGEPAIDAESERVVFHCRATAKKEMPGRSNSLSFRVEFSPRAMKAQGKPDL